MYTDEQIIEALEIRMPHDALCREAYDLIQRQRAEGDRWRINLEAVFEEIPQTKAELAREIFEEMEKNTRFTINLVEAMEFDSEEIRKSKLECYRDCLGYYGKLKKKYTESLE